MAKLKHLDQQFLERLKEADASEFGDNLAVIAEALVSNSALGIALRASFGYELDEFLHDYAFIESKIQSPIEKKFIEALYIVAPKWGYPIKDSGNGITLEGLKSGKAVVYPGLDLFVCPQFQVTLERKYILDFLLFTRSRSSNEDNFKFLAIECDGHDFHEKTKEQVAKDKARDRDLKINGVDLFRFTGSEIHNSPIECAEQAVQYLNKLNRGQ